MPGIGRRLLEYGAEHYGIREVTVNEQNPQAVGFYEHMGFVTDKRTDRDEPESLSIPSIAPAIPIKSTHIPLAFCSES